MNAGSTVKYHNRTAIVLETQTTSQGEQAAIQFEDGTTEIVNSDELERA